MDWSGTFLVEYFFLLAISLVMIVNCILRFRQHPRLSVYSLLIIGAAILLSVSKSLEGLGKQMCNIGLTTFFCFLGYVLYPCCLFLFIMMSGTIDTKKRYFFLLYLPLILNALVYVLMFIPGAKEQVVVFTLAKDQNDLVFNSGILHYSSHIISALYLFFLLFISFSKISSKHITHGLTILACAFFVVAAVIIESFFNSEDKIHILSTTIVFSTIVYYLYLYIERSQIDTLTGLFNRETYYRDIIKFDKSVNGVIQFDMNGLKYINDNYGHTEGDKALSTIARLISSCTKRNMYVYRLGGDEFVLLALNTNEAQLNEAANKFSEKIKATEYHCSIGIAIRENKQQPLEEALKEAERRMYENKTEFYKTADFDRRKV